MSDGGARWDERYRSAPDPVPRPPDGLAGMVEIVPWGPGRRALDVACGLGAVTLWAAGQGFAVDALDRSAVAVGRLRHRADELGLAALVRARVNDVAGGVPDELPGPYDLLVCQRYRDPAVIETLPALLAPGGILVVTVLSAVGARSRSRFAAARGELSRFAASAAGTEVLLDVEGGGEATVVLRRPRPRSAPADQHRPR